MNKPPGRFWTDGSPEKSANDSSSASVATTASARVMCTWFTRIGGSATTASVPREVSRNAFSYASSKESSFERAFRVCFAPKESSFGSKRKGFRGSSKTPASTPSLNTARAAAARAPRMNVSPPPGSSATAAIAASAPPGERSASNTTPYVSRPGPDSSFFFFVSELSPPTDFMSTYSRSASLQSPARPSVVMSAWRVARLCGTFAARISSHVARAAAAASASPAAAAAAHVPSTHPKVYTSGSSGVLSRTSASSARATATPPLGVSA